MTPDTLKQITTDALDKLATLLDAGQSDQLTALIKTMARFHRYSWHNVALIMSQRPAATRVAGFQTWRALHRFVRKGEKGIAIMAPIVRRRDTNAERDSVVGFRAAYVFDVEQTEGEPLPAPATASGNPGDKTAALKAAILSQGIDLQAVDDLGGALGTSSGGRIQLLTGLSPALEFTTLVHEWAHELLHHAADRPASPRHTGTRGRGRRVHRRRSHGTSSVRLVSRLYPSVSWRSRGAGAITHTRAANGRRHSPGD